MTHEQELADLRADLAEALDLLRTCTLITTNAECNRLDVLLEKHKEAMNKHAIRGSELALDEAIARLQSSVHAGLACMSAVDCGKKLAASVREHMSKITDALRNWEEALRHYEDMHKEKP